MEMERRLCVTCCQPLLENVSPLVKVFPGSQGSTTLNNSLRVYFISRKLLKLKESQCLRILQSNPRCFRENEADRNLFQMCENCECIVDKAIECHAKILTLKREIDVLGDSLSNIVNDVQVENNGGVPVAGDVAFKEFRSLICTGVPNSEVSIIKVEVEPENVLIPQDETDNDYEYPFEESLLPDDDEDSEENARMESRHSTRKSLRAKKKRRVQSDSDSEYDPGWDMEVTTSKKKRFKPSSFPSQKSSNVIMAGSPRKVLFFGKYRGIVIDRSKTQFTCKFCTTVIEYTSPNGFKRHLLAHQDSDKIGNLYDCTKCGHPNLTEDTLRRHLSKYHETMKNTCQICGHASLRRWLHDKHMLKVHNIKNWTPISVPEDLKKKMAAVRPDDNVALNTGPSEKTYNCELCESVYLTPAGIRKHISNHQESNRLGNKFDCHICQHPNVSEHSLKLHLTNMHGCIVSESPSDNKNSSKPDENVDKLATTPDVLENTESSDSIKLETNEEKLLDRKGGATAILKFSEGSGDNFSCKKCPSVFVTMPGFKKHMRIHKASKLLGKRFDCHVCRYPTTSVGLLRRHLTNVHGVDGADLPPTPEMNEGGTDDNSEKEDNDADHLIDTMPEPQPSSPSSDISRKVFLRKRRVSRQNAYNDSVSDEDDDVKSTEPRNEEDDDWCPSDVGEESDKRQSSRPVSDEDEDDTDFQLRKPEEYICSICNVAYKSARGFRKHQQEHKASVALKHKYDCDKCGYPTSSERKLRYHKKRVHQETFKHSCKFCSFQTKKTSNLKDHMLKHAIGYQKKKIGRKPIWNDRLKPDGEFECVLCQSSYKSSTTLKRHMREHAKSQTMENTFNCELCKFPCLDAKSLRRHQLRSHNERNFTCKLCDKTFLKANVLKTHMDVHKRYDRFKDDTGYYQCPMCDYRGSMQGFVLHKNHKHNGMKLADNDEDFLCNQCGLNFTTTVNLRIHIKTKHEKRFRNTCHICGKGFESIVAFRGHIKTHDKNRIREFVCSTCGTAYSHKKTLDDHIARFHPDEYNQPYTSLAIRAEKPGNHKCKWCDMVFPFKYLLVNHMPTAHKNLYNFTCDVCNKSYISASSLKLHKEITHSGKDQQYSCGYCGKTFVHKHYVICHYKFCAVKRSGGEATSHKELPVDNESVFEPPSSATNEQGVDPLGDLTSPMVDVLDNSSSTTVKPEDCGVDRASDGLVSVPNDFVPTQRYFDVSK